jgi:putative effector of murein hydrolase
MYILCLYIRSVTVALALPIGAALGAGAQAPLTAVTVVLTGLLGANFAQVTLDKLGHR